MRRRLVRHCRAGLLALALAVGMAAPAVAAEPVDPGKWAKKFCGAVGGWLLAVDEAASVEPAPAGDLLAVSAQLDELLADTEAATRRLVKQVKKAGVPDLGKGAKIAKVYRNVYGDLAAALADARDELLSVDRGSPDAEVDAFPNAVAAAQGALEVALSDAQAQIDAADVLVSKPLTKTLRREASCVAITG